jgi:hypothetical protein
VLEIEKARAPALLTTRETERRQMLSTDMHCEMLTNTIRDKSKAMYDAFKLFVQMFSGVAGGTVLIRLQYVDQISMNFVWLSDSLATLVTITAAFIVVDHYWSWWNYRTTLAAISGPDEQGNFIPAPKWTSGIVMSLMLFVMLLATALFILFNHFVTFSSSASLSVLV